MALAFEACAANRRVDGVRGGLLRVVEADVARLAVRVFVVRLPPSNLFQLTPQYLEDVSSAPDRVRRDDGRSGPNAHASSCGGVTDGASTALHVALAFEAASRIALARAAFKSRGASP